MKTSTCLLYCLMFASLGSIHAQFVTRTRGGSSQQSASQKDVEQEIIRLEKRLWNADASEVSKLEAEDCEVIKHAHRYHRADDEAAAKDVKFALVSMDDIRVRTMNLLGRASLLCSRITVRLWATSSTAKTSQSMAAHKMSRPLSVIREFIRECHSVPKKTAGLCTCQ